MDMCWSKGPCASGTGGLQGSRKGAEVAQRALDKERCWRKGRFKDRGAGDIVWIGKALEWAERGTGSCGKGWSATQAERLQGEVETSRVTELVVRGLPCRKGSYQEQQPLHGAGSESAGLDPGMS